MSTPLRYGTAIFAVGVAFSLRLLLEPLTGTGAPFILFFGATLAVGYFCGRWPGVLAALLAAPIGSYYFVVLAGYTFWQAITQGVLFFFEGCVMSWIASEVHTSRCEADRKAKEAQLAAETRDGLLATLSHDIKNPLTAIDMRALLLESTSELQVVREQSRVIRRTIQGLIKLMDNLILLGRMEAKELHLSNEACSAPHVLGEAQEIFEPLAKAKGIELKICSEDLCVQGDPVRILEVLSNLMGNAIKFTTEGGTIRVSVGRTSKGITFSVRDTGVGITDNQLPHVFDRYWQAKNSGRSGSGLGLAIAKGIVETLGGEIWVESRAGVGTVFCFTVPESYSKGLKPHEAQPAFQSFAAVSE